MFILYKPKKKKRKFYLKENLFKDKRVLARQIDNIWYIRKGFKISTKFLKDDF